MVDVDDKVRRSALMALEHCDTGTLVRLASLISGGTERASHLEDHSYLLHLKTVANSDVQGLIRAEQSYGDSWKRRGGVDTFHMLTRKWDRLETRVSGAITGQESQKQASPYDIFEHIAADTRADGFIDDIRDLRRYLMLVEAESTARKELCVPDSERGYLDYLQSIADADVNTITSKQSVYGSSWKRRGGIAAFMMLARKWDRIAQRVTAALGEGHAQASRDNVFEHISADMRPEGVINDIRDLRQYLLLVEAEMVGRGEAVAGTSRDNLEQG